MREPRQLRDGVVPAQDMEQALMEECEKDGKIFYEGPEGSEGTRGGWVGKVIQLYETTKVRISAF